LAEKNITTKASRGLGQGFKCPSQKRKRKAKGSHLWKVSNKVKGETLKNSQTHKIFLRDALARGADKRKKGTPRGQNDVAKGSTKVKVPGCKTEENFPAREKREPFFEDVLEEEPDQEKGDSETQATPLNPLFPRGWEGPWGTYRKKKSGGRAPPCPSAWGFFLKRKKIQKIRVQRTLNWEIRE